MKIFTYPSQAAEKRLQQITGRSLAFRQKDLQAVRRILADVQKGGDGALIKYVNRFDAPHLTTAQLRVDPDEIRAAGRRVDRAFV
ncbi:MAG: histidinol dehydrogenase, partial [Deltaproteobacteria bacterium]